MAVSASLVMAACNDVVLMESVQDTGYLCVNLGMDDQVSTKAATAPPADMAFKIEIYKGEELVVELEDHRSVTQEAPVELAVGKYVVKAVYGNGKAGFDVPYYVGESEVVVKTDDMVSADITCTLANVMVTVDFEDSLKDNFKSYSVFVEDGTGMGITFDSTSENLDAVGYIPATGTLKWTLMLVNTAGEIYTASDSYSGVRERQHYDLQFGLSENEGDVGYAAIRLVIDDTLIEQEYDIELDFSDSELPTVSSNEGFELTKEISVIVGDATKKELTFSAPEGIKSVVVALDKIYELVEASQSVITELSGMGIKTSSVQYGATSVVIDLTEYVRVLPTGEFNVNVTLYDAKGHVVNCPMNFAVISDVDADMVSVDPWAEFAVVKGKYFSQNIPEGATFMYRKSSESSWTTVSAELLSVDETSKTFEAEIGGLDPQSTYVIKAVSADDVETREVEFVTDAAEQLYNMSFDDWYKDGKVYYPFANGSDPNVWDAANKATASFGGSTTVPEESHVISGKAARMESKYIVIAFAAGNLYTGNFGKVNGVGASLDWGAEFSCRPVALRGYYDYSPATINRTKSPYEGMKGTTDKCQIMVLLTDWSEQFTINTTENTFVDIENDPHIIASVKFESDVKTDGYKEFLLPIEYRDLTRTPKYAVVVACSSYLGDYFTGGEGSVLYVDEFSFEYDITKLTEEQKEKVNYK